VLLGPWSRCGGFDPLLLLIFSLLLSLLQLGLAGNIVSRRTGDTTCKGGGALT
jgi:hypothetical protein